MARPMIWFALTTLALAGSGNGDPANPLALSKSRQAGGEGVAAALEAADPPSPTHPSYRVADQRSPFEPAASTSKNAAEREAARPDNGRVRQPLEAFSLGRLAMVGTLSGRGVTYALVRDPTGRVRRLAVGDYLGTDHGRVSAIHATGIELLEVIRDGTGGWIWRARKLTLLVAGTTADHGNSGEDG